MTHGELFLLLVLIYGCLNPMITPCTWTSVSRTVLVIAIIYNFVVWIIDTIQPLNSGL